ncbi:MAG TPA: class I SAM-dependent methyltransferase, partial [Longimicrobiaceae bacterium]|nr:class I SAM-dependent methyltransferase [Longimicrobiaceae bacterium]
MRTDPSVLDLVRLSPDPVFPPGGEALYRQIALLTELKPDAEVLDVACGRGITTTYLASTFGAGAAGVDVDPHLIMDAEARARSLGLEVKVTFQMAPLDDLPYHDDVFDVSIGEVALAAEFDPAAAIRELARVTKPYGAVVLVQLV